MNEALTRTGRFEDRIMIIGTVVTVTIDVLSRSAMVVNVAKISDSFNPPLSECELPYGADPDRFARLAVVVHPASDGNT